MSLENLRRDAESAVGNQIDVHRIPSSDICEFDDANPADSIKIGRRWVIRIWDHLDETDSKEAEAHELAHILLCASGLASLSASGGPDSEMEVLALVVSNAVSHHHVVQLLEREYQIGSGTHITALEHRLDEIRQNPPTNDYIRVELHRLGIILFDCERAGLLTEAKADRLASLQPDIAAALDCARKYLGPIAPDMTAEEQQRLVITFLNKLGYDQCAFLF